MNTKIHAYVNSSYQYNFLVSDGDPQQWNNGLHGDNGDQGSLLRTCHWKKWN